MRKCNVTMPSPVTPMTPENHSWSMLPIGQHSQWWATWTTVVGHFTIWCHLNRTCMSSSATTTFHLRHGQNKISLTMATTISFKITKIFFYYYSIWLESRHDWNLKQKFWVLITKCGKISISVHCITEYHYWMMNLIHMRLSRTTTVHVDVKQITNWATATLG